MPSDTLVITDARAGFLHARILVNLDQPGRPVERAELMTELLGPNLGELVVADADYPVTWMVCQSQTTFVFVASGVRTATAVANLCRSYLSERENSEVRQFPDYISLVCDQIMAARQFPTRVTNQRIICIGHSMGSGVAACIATRLANASADSQVKLSTFGSAKFMGRPAITAMARVQSARWLIEGDPVPALPPTTAQATDLHALLPARDRSRLNGWIHVEQCLQITEDGAIALRPEDPQPPPFRETTINALCNGRNGFFGPLHAISRYRDYLRSAVVVVQTSGYVDATGAVVAAGTEFAPRVPVLIPPPPIVAPPRVVVPAALEETMRNTVIAFRAAAETHAGIAVIIPRLDRMQAVNQNGVWFVSWMNNFICCGPTKKKARALCRHFNKFLDIYQGVAVSYSAVFGDSLAQYLASASIPAGPFQPRLNTQGGFGTIDDLFRHMSGR